MNPLYKQKEFNNAKSTDKLPCKCYRCKNTFLLTKREIKNALNPKTRSKGKYCSKNCTPQSLKTKQKIKCKSCDKEFEKFPGEIKKYKNHFCSRSCSATYNNKNKTHGTRRSKLEIWLEEQITSLYPKLEIHYNRKDAINSELDIYIPSFNLAIEINGIFHYKPIFGEDKFNKIVKNDQNKLQSCIDEGIEIVSIDVSQLNYFKPKKAQKYLDIICQLISNKSKNVLKS